MIKKTILILFCCCLATIIFAQTKVVEKRNFSNELGLNVTNLLTDLLGNNNLSSPGAYLLTYKRLRDNKALRVGATVNFSFKNQSDFGFTSDLINQNFQLRVGRETRQNISPKFQYYYGVDAIAGFQQEQSNVRANSGQVIQTDKIILVGAGPVLGFQFALYDRLLIGTEGSLYVSYNKNAVDFKTSGISGAAFPSKNTTGLNIQTNLPKFLFLIVKF
jgi:hypothetical protein